MSRALTAQGMIVGTMQYMSPEQLEGKEVGAQSDIFSFGAMLYEMATGEKAFEAKSQASLIASILKEEPRPMRELQPMTPLLLGHIVRTCLAKDPDEWLQNAQDLKLELDWIRESSGISDVAKWGSKNPRRGAKLWASLSPPWCWRSWGWLYLYSGSGHNRPRRNVSSFRSLCRKWRAIWRVRLTAACWRSCHLVKPPVLTS
jgi:serine/threonine protein kinase